MFQRNCYRGMFIALIFTVIVQDGLLFAQAVEPASIVGKLNRDSFVLCRDIRTKFRGIRGQRTLFSKAYEIHEMADNVHRMVVVNAPIHGMDRALADLSLLVDDMKLTIKGMRLPVFRDPVTIPTGPNGYVFYGGNGYPQPRFGCDRFPYRMIPEQNMREMSQMLADMKNSIVQLQAYYSPPLHQPPTQRLFPLPGPVPRFDSNLNQRPQPARVPELLEDKNDSRWKPSSKTAPVFPPVPRKETPKPSQSGPLFLPPIPSAN